MTIRVATFATLALLVLVAPIAPAQPLTLDAAVRTGRLDNGLRYYVRENRQPRGRAELRLAIRAGSILEEPDQQGLAHFVEHMAFNGTQRFAKSAIVLRMTPTVSGTDPALVATCPTK